jgi:hypothetical protein
MRRMIAEVEWLIVRANGRRRAIGVGRARIVGIGGLMLHTCTRLRIVHCHVLRTRLIVRIGLHLDSRRTLA